MHTVQACQEAPKSGNAFALSNGGGTIDMLQVQASVFICPIIYIASLYLKSAV